MGLHLFVNDPIGHKFLACHRRQLASAYDLLFQGAWPDAKHFY